MLLSLSASPLPVNLLQIVLQHHLHSANLNHLIQVKQGSNLGPQQHHKALRRAVLRLAIRQAAHRLLLVNRQ